MKTKLKSIYQKFIDNFKPKSRSEIIEDLIQAIVDNLTKSANISNSETAHVSLEVKNRVKTILSQRKESLEKELISTASAINTL